MTVSLITVCLNAGAALRNSLASGLDQSWDAIELLIQDGGSTDGSVADALAMLSARGLGRSPAGRPLTGADRAFDLTDGPRSVHVRVEADAGIYDALNRGMRRATGEVIGILHADDRFADADVLTRVMQVFENGAEAVYGDLRYVRYAGGNMRVVRHWRSGTYDRRRLRWGWMPPHPALFLRRDVYARAALADGVCFDPAFRCAGDYEFILRALPLLRVPPVYLPHVLVLMRIGGVSNRSVRHIVRKSAEDWRAIRRHRVGWVHTLIAKNLRKIGQFHVRA